MSKEKNKVKVFVGWAGIVILPKKGKTIDITTEHYTEVPIFAIYPLKKNANYELKKKVRITVEEL